MAEEKNNKPSQRKMDKARKDGKLIKSSVATQACVFVCTVFTVYLLMDSFIFSFVEIAQICWLNTGRGYDQCLDAGAGTLFYFSVAVILVAAVSGLGLEILLIGWKPDFSQLSPKSERFNFVSGFKKVFGNWRELFQLLIKFSIFVIVATLFFKQAFPKLLLSFSLNVHLAKAQLFGLFFDALFYLSFVWIALAGYDYFCKRKKYYQELSMSDDEVRREHKDSEGDPIIKAHRRFLHEELLMRDVVKRIKQANVIIVEKAD